MTPAGQAKFDRPWGLGFSMKSLLSSVAYGDTSLPEEGGYGSSACSTGDTNVISVTLGSFLRKELGEALRIGPKIS